MSWKVGDNLCNAQVKQRQEIQYVKRRACGHNKTCQKGDKKCVVGYEAEEGWHSGKGHESLKRI